MLNRDFNENDYEMLLQLDENVSPKGASKDKIAALPCYSLEKAGDVACCICLNDMEVGVEVRKLPCDHFFHKECIDQWLLVNRTCPIDKKGVHETDL